MADGKGPSSSRPRLEWVKPPQQARSQQTLERLLDAAEALVDERGIEGITVAEVARRAGSSVGAFYTRFPDKDALIRTVFERFHAQALATAEAVIAAEVWVETPLEEVLETMVGFMLNVLGARRTLVVALLHRASQDDELNALGHRLHGRITTLLLDLLHDRGIEVDPPDPPLATSMASWLALGLMESRALLGPTDQPPVPEPDLGREVARMVVRYLGLDELAASRRGGRSSGSGSNRGGDGDSDARRSDAADVGSPGKKDKEASHASSWRSRCP
ncbi:MAG: TetR/AcrR family transcriptional regulator [Myxococcota bacterium]